MRITEKIKQHKESILFRYGFVYDKKSGDYVNLRDGYHLLPCLVNCEFIRTIHILKKYYEYKK